VWYPKMKLARCRVLSQEPPDPCHFPALHPQLKMSESQQRIRTPPIDPLAGLRCDIVLPNHRSHHSTSMTSPASPRLPSPPPIPEDQLSPVSASPEQQQELFSNLQHAAERRIRPGTKAEDMAEGPPLIDLSEVRAYSLHWQRRIANMMGRSTQPSSSQSTSRRFTTSSHTPSDRIAQYP
jgi:hypothetical protein